MADKSAAAKKDDNALNQDAIRAQMINKELQTMKVWEEKWGFLSKRAKREVSNNPTENPFGIPVPSKTPRLVPQDKMINPEDDKPISLEDLTPEDMKAFYLITHQTSKLKQATGEIHDKYYFPPTSSSQIGWWTVSAGKRLEEERKSIDAARLNTLMDRYLSNNKGH